MFQTQIDLSARNTLTLPARAEFFAAVDSVEQLAALARHPDLVGRRRFVLGGGSNLVLTGDFSGLVLHMNLKEKSLAGEDGEHYYVAAAAGENWSDFVRWTLEQGWPGLENLSLIPGTAGAAPIQNIGAYGVEAGDFLHLVEALDLDAGRPCKFSIDDCALGYRESLFKREGWHLSGRYAITRVIFRLPKRWRPRAAYGELAAELVRAGISQPTPGEMAAAVIALRQRKLPDPAEFPNAGSFFQNPIVSAEFAAALGEAHPGLPRYREADGRVKLAAGWLIEQTGWKGRNLGPVGMYEKQALVLVNRGGATFRDVQNLTRAVREAILARFGVNLVPEPVFL
ncbi:MAG: UDP-N-acetylmuramate dehydrogenase [Zoogloeaceae bacterium]|jgi:UDP-N-acetylmuramate dehydrogenase|nr:UDP-N-acetylmuramate dehydrogenase [Zoogloeaceae bacterium]